MYNFGKTTYPPSKPKLAMSSKRQHSLVTKLNEPPFEPRPNQARLYSAREMPARSQHCLENWDHEGTLFPEGSERGLLRSPRADRYRPGQGEQQQHLLEQVVVRRRGRAAACGFA